MLSVGLEVKVQDIRRDWKINQQGDRRKLAGGAEN